jgi:cell division septation protein DedD
VSANLQSGSLSAQADRRNFFRQRVLLSAVELGDDNGGIVLNLSEGGLALRAVSQVAGDELPNLRFQFSQSDVWVETRARVTWRSDSKTSAGVEFIDLPDEARKQIKEWIAFTSDDAGVETETASRESAGRLPNALITPEPRVTQNRDDFPFSVFGSVPVETRHADAGAGIASAESIARSSGKPRRVFLPALAALIVLSALAFLGYTLRRMHPKTTGAETPAAMTLPPNPTESGTVSQAPPADAGATLDTPGYVLLVGALVREEDAEKLAESLRQKQFPAFVFKRDPSRLYHVVVGPYNKSDSSAMAKTLEQRGFEVIRTEWNPEPQ